MKFISVQDLYRMISDKSDFQLIDVRESYEYEDSNIGGMNIPLGEILGETDRIPKDKPVVLCCKSGKRSAAMTLTLERKFGMDNLLTLQGGLELYFESKQ